MTNRSPKTPAQLSAWFQAAVQHHTQGNLETAKSICQQILTADKRHAHAMHVLGLIAHQQGDNAGAIKLLRQAIGVQPSEPLFYGNLAYLLRLQGHLDEALACYENELLLKPNLPDTLNNMGSTLRALGRLAEAANCYQRAVALQPSHFEAHCNLGNIFLAQGLPSEAMRSYQTAIKLNPAFAEAHVNMGKAFLDQDRLDEAAQCFQQATEINPGLTVAHSNLGKVRLIQGHLALALAAYQQCEPSNDKSSLLIKYALHLPAIMGDRGELTLSRARLEASVSHLSGHVTLEDPIKEGCSTNFYLAFQAFNDRDIQKKIAELYASACPSLTYVAASCSQLRPSGQKRRLGFLSKFIFAHSVSKSFGYIVKALSADPRFEVVLISPHDPRDFPTKEVYDGFQGENIVLSADLSVAREQIDELALDVLTYLDIGMEPLSYFLSFARLAPIQCVLGGHPVTTGVSNVDYFVSSDMGEPENAQEHYTEQLIRLPYGVFYFDRPTLPASFKSREELGLPVAGRIYLCPMTLQKIHPDFDEAISRILQLDPQGHVVFFEDRSVIEWKAILTRRFQKTIAPDFQRRINFVPWIVDPIDFGSAVAASEVVLDSFHFGIGTTAIVTCSVGTPFVTKPGEFLRGRVGLFYCKLLDTMECVADTTEHYAQLAVSIATTPTLHQKIKTKILANNAAIFENQRGVSDALGFFADIRPRAITC